MLKIGFTGDLAFSKYFSDLYNKKDFIDISIRNFMADNDYNIVNLEGPLCSYKYSSNSGEYIHSSDPSSASVLASLGYKILSLANNHTTDYGIEGLRETLKTAKKYGLKTIGAGMNRDEASKPIILSQDNVSVGVFSISFSRGLSAKVNSPGIFDFNNENLLRERMKELQKKVNWIVVLCHIGDEFADVPMPYVRSRLKKYCKYGANIIVGTHPHVTNGFEYHGHSLIFYSLGNYIFDTDYQRNYERTDRGVLLNVEFTETKYSYDYLPIFIDRQNQVVRRGEIDRYFVPLTRENYKKMWKKAAYQLVTQRLQLVKNAEKSAIISSRNVKKKIRVPKFILRFYHVIINPELRTKIFGAAMYIFISKLRRLN